MGREWNDKLHRRLEDSTCKAADRPHATRILVTDFENSEQTLIEILGLIDGVEQVVAEFITTPKSKKLRYREEHDWLR